MGATTKEKNKSSSSTSLNITDDSRTRLMFDNSSKKIKENGFQSSSFLQMLRYATTFDYFLLIAGIVFSILDGLSAPVGCIIFKMITDALMKAQPYYMNGTLVEEYPTFNEEIIWCCSLYFFQGLNMFILTMLAMGCFYTLSERQAYKIKQHFFATVLKQDMEWFDKKEVGALTQIMTSGIDKIRNGTSDKLVLILKSTANLISGILIGFYLCWELTLVLIAMAPVLIASIYITNRMLMTQTKKEMSAYSIASSIAEEVLSAIRTVMAFNAQFFELKRYEDCLVNARKIGFRKAFIVSVCNGIYIFVEFVAIGMGFWYGAKLVYESGVSPGTVFGVFWAVFIAAMRFGQAVPQFSTIINAKMAAGEIFEIIDTQPKLDRTIGLKHDTIKGEIEFSDVVFSYPSRKSIKVLNGISFTVPAGKNVALVGHSGCGKSTTIGLLMKYYEHSMGTIKIDGKLIEDLNVEWLRSMIGIVSQEPVLFHGTIIENLKMGFSNVNQEEMEEACKDANAHEFIIKLPNGYESLIGEGGVKLSGGQKQRIAIARALIRKPKILLLDEATSALDTESERLVQIALDKATTGRTTITIAHRLSTVKNADNIIVFDKGNIIESGTHTELMEKVNGFYRKLVSSQEIETLFDEEKLQDSSRVLSSSRKSSRKESAESASIKSIVGDDNEDDEEASEMHALLKKEGAKPASAFQIIKYAKPELVIAIIGFVLSLVRGASWPLFSVLYGALFKVFSNKTFDSDAENIVLWITIGFIGVGICGGISTWLSGYLLGLVGEKVNVRLRMDVYRNLMRQDGEYYDNVSHSVGKLTARLSTDSNNVQAAIDQRLADVLQGVTSLVAGLAVAMYFGWNIAPFCLITSIVFIGIQFAISFAVKKRAQHDTQSSENEATVCSESISNVKTIQALVQEDVIFDKFLVASKKPNSRAICRGWLMSVTYSVAAAFVSLNFCVSYFIGLIMIDNQYCSPFIVFQVIEALNVATLMIMATASYFPEYTRAKLSAGLIFHMLKQEPKIDSLSEDGEKTELTGNVVFKNVEFSYPNGRHTLTLSSMTIKAKYGQTIALVGPSGCGKSTIIQLLERYYDVLGGTIKLDGIDIRSLNIRHLRNSIAVVGQEPTLFNLSIGENIAYGIENPTFEQIQKAAQLANIDTFIESLPNGYNTNVGGKGTQLSGGQKQRIAIARAVIREPKILLLDEATAALDSESEKIVQDALDHAKNGRTCITVAHRLSTIQNADKICVIENGKCVENGNHQNLLAKKGLYSKLVEKQQV
uniref:Uncharacterized protein n=1 Tax=Panagrolaimus sp. PS1159 TaxID=55785 RepID=A0AC35GLM7_9BILA